MEATLLVELLTEELPPKSLRRLGDTFGQEIFNGLVQHQLKQRVPDMRWFATPRRLSVSIPQILEKAQDRETAVEGPSVSAPAAALAGFAKKHGVSVDSLEHKETAKGNVVVARMNIPGAALDKVLSDIVLSALKKLPIQKVMRWGDGDAQFVRPAHKLVMMHGARVVPGKVLGLESGNVTRGHRFMSAGDIVLANADEYETRLKADGRVIASFADRKALIDVALVSKAKELSASLGEYADLLDEVTALVEHPSIYVGAFDSQFLEVPQECLILTMRQNQKYFPLFDVAGRLLPKFLIVSNMDVADPRYIIGGNQRVIRPRLEDARFFYTQDRKVRLEERVPQLAKVVYHNKLGTQLERTERVQILAGKIARILGANADSAERAAWLAKADLITGMVGEFPELQGTMGRYYALHDGESQTVADAIEAHYLPRFAGDRLPENPVSAAVALADKLDTLVGIFGIGGAPTGDKDPFALRRLALGVLRILAELKLPLDLEDLLKSAHNGFGSGLLKESHERGGISVPNYVEVSFFVRERAKGYLRDFGYSALEIESVLDLGPNPSEFRNRLDAVRGFLKLQDAAGLAESDKRIRNILSKSGGDSVIRLADESLFTEEAERQLLNTTRLLRQQVESLLKAEDFNQALLLTSQVHMPVRYFFEKVMVNVEDLNVRNNRFALLHEVSNLTNRVANISKLAA
jgi:glycyl-tRNA synthetase beta chain